MEDKDYKDNENKDEEQNDFEEQVNEVGDTIKRATMVAIGGVANAAEAIAKSVQNVATKENLEKLAQKGEQAVKQVKDFSESTAKQVKDFSESTAKQVKDFSSETMNKMKKAKEENEENEEIFDVDIESIEDDIIASLKKAEDLIDRYLNKDKSDEKVKIVRELLKQKEEINNIKNKMSVIIEEEKERIKREKEELGLDNDEHKED